MAFPRIGGPGVPLDLSAMQAAWSRAQGQGGGGFGFNEVTLPAGGTWPVPAGIFQITPGPLTQVQFLDPITQIYRSFGQVSNTPSIVQGDGVNWRLANMSGCLIGGLVTNGGTGYSVTNPPTVAAATGGGSLRAIVGGAISIASTPGANYQYPPIVVVASPPPGGVQATIVAALSGATATFTLVNAGAGYQQPPQVLVVNDPRDTTGGGATVTASLAGAGAVTAVLLANHGTPVSAVPTLNISGGGGTGAAITAIMCFTATGFTVGTGGAGYVGAANITSAGGIVAGVAPLPNPAVSTGLLVPRPANIQAAVTGGAITATGSIVVDGGLFQTVPLAILSGTATTGGAATLTVGGSADTSLIQPI